MLMDSKDRKCSFCGENKISKYWVFKESAYCSYRCYAIGNAKLLLILSLFFGILFIGSMTGLAIAGISPAIHVPFVIAMVFGPIPGLLTSILGFIYKKQDRKATEVADMENQ